MSNEEVDIEEGVDQSYESAAGDIIRTIHECMAKDQVGKIVNLLRKNKQQLEAILSERDSQGQTLLLWATLNGKFVLIEYLLRQGQRNSFGFKDKKALEVYDKWVEERKRIAEVEEAKRKAKEAGEEVEEEAEEGEEGEKPPSFAERVAQEIGMSVYKVNQIGELGHYEGNLDENGMRSGVGINLFPNGDIYIGEYANNQRNGKGTYLYSSGAFYTGDFKNNMKHGMGRCVYPDGGRYYGSWVENEKSGKGVYTYENGDTYAGEWDADMKHGSGTYEFIEDRSEYEGTWEHGSFVQGVWKMPNGVTYEGRFTNTDGSEGPTSFQKGVFTFSKRGFKQEGVFRPLRLPEGVGRKERTVLNWNAASTENIA